MKITVAQLDPTVGDIDGSVLKINDVVKAHSGNTDLIVFPELFLTGYPPRDMLGMPGFMSRVKEGLEKVKIISSEYPEIGVLVGTPIENDIKGNKGLYNSAVLFLNGEVAGMQHKSLLPTYDVFDETRYFDPALGVDIIPFKTHKLGISICEDMWNTTMGYSYDPIAELSRKGATVFINLSASPFYAGKEKLRYELLQSHSTKYKIPFLFVNQVGGNDELIFDGNSILVDRNGDVANMFPGFVEHIETVDIGSKGNKDITLKDDIESVYKALVLGLRDYTRKCGFKKVVLGLSGGIDSAVTAVIAKEAVGSENVLGVSMPSPFSTQESYDYAKNLVDNLGIDLKNIEISKTYEAYVNSMKTDLEINESEVDVYLQNIQARIRGNILMAFSNRYGYLVLSTGNKSEIAVGYCTLYGDMAGGLGVLSDLPKNMVYHLADFINKDLTIIPEEIVKRAPTAELKPGQCDQDSLPSYDVLDKILILYLEEHASFEEIVEKGIDPRTVKWVIRAVNDNEYKRWQASPGLKVTTKAFGVGRRMPIAAKYKF